MINQGIGGAEVSGMISQHDTWRAPHYYAAVSQWFDRLPLDDQERVHPVQYVYSTPGYGGEPAAITYAALLPSVPVPPELIRKAWGHGGTEL
jgi:hypothetical protein